LKEIHGKYLYLPKKFYHSGALITAPSDREYSRWKLTIALSCLPVGTAYLDLLVSGFLPGAWRQAARKQVGIDKLWELLEMSKTQ